jgi:ATP-dependent exoDNAse (exonuclease V) beta subunit
VSAEGEQLSFEGVGGAQEQAADAAATEELGFEATAEQVAAIESRDHDAFLEAGAGSGKTTVLVDRYCAAVLEDGVEIDQLLAFTFTERAAAEMRTRVRRELTRRSRQTRERGDSALADELLTAARSTERAWVMTIHAFCRRLLASHPLAAGLDPRFRVLDASESARLRDEAITTAIDDLLAAGDQDVSRAAAEFEPWRLTAMTLGAYERLRSQGMSTPRLPDVGDPVHSVKPDDEPRDLTPAEVEAAKSSRSALERILEGFHRRYAELKDERSALDFADLELRALELLRSSPAVAAAWRGRFAQIMVDEFQDTNRVQLALVDALRGDETKIFMVGDEHQSIYRFRNADLDVFREQRRLTDEHPEREVLPLRGNFRSLPAVLGAVNLIGETLLDGFDPLTAGRDPGDGPGGVELLLTRDRSSADPAMKWDAEEIDLDPGPSASPQHIIAEARRLAERLRELVDDGQASRGDIVVLLRAFTHVDAYEQALRRAGLKPFVVGGRGYWTQQQVEDVIRILGSVANPLDDEHLLGALASFAAGVSPDALWLLRHAARSESGHPRHIWPVLEWRYAAGREPSHVEAHWLDAIPEVDQGRLRRFCEILAGLRRRAMLVSLEDLIEETITAFGYDLGSIARDGGPGRMANIRKLMRLAREYEADEGRNLRGFLALAAASTRRDEREGMAAVQAEGHDGVRVMTVHAAKGLQFPVVAVPDLGRALNAGHRHADLVIGPERDDGPPRFGMRLAFASESSVPLWELVELNTLENEAEAEEGCRLVYVAASRAEDRLILSGVYSESQLEPSEQKAGDTPLRRLLPALCERGWDGATAIVDLPGPVTVTGEQLPPAELAISIETPDPERAGELRRITPPPAEDDSLEGEGERPPLLAGLQPTVPVGHLSYSAVSLYESCGYRFYVERVLGAREGLAPSAAASSADEIAEPEVADEMPDPGRPRALALGIGNTVHAALEWSANNGWREPDDDLLWPMLSREGLAGDQEALNRVRSLVSGWLGSELSRELTHATDIRAEVPFVLGIGDTVIRGQIDLLARDNGVPCVVDYKTDGLHGQPPAALADRYTAQREIYALAVGAEAGAKVAHVFLEAPEQPVIQELGPGDLARARTRLEGLIADMRGNQFRPAEDPYEALCFGCPAAARLCPNAKWHPGR